MIRAANVRRYGSYEEVGYKKNEQEGAPAGAGHGRGNGEIGSKEGPNVRADASEKSDP